MRGGSMRGWRGRSVTQALPQRPAMPAHPDPRLGAGLMWKSLPTTGGTPTGVTPLWGQGTRDGAA